MVLIRTSLCFFLATIGHCVLGDDLETADSIHQEALILANAGDLEGALPYFKRAAKFDPTKDTYWSNLGVTQMRLNMLDDALVSFTKGSRINPDSSLINDNINSLQEYMVSQEALEIDVEEDEEEDDEDETEEEEEDEIEEIRLPPSPKMNKREKMNQQASSNTNTKSSRSKIKNSRKKTTDSLKIEDWFGSWWDKKDELTPVIKEALVNFRPVQIRNFLKPEMALALHDELYNSPDFDVYESYNRWYQFHFSAIYQHHANYDKNVLLSEISDVMHLQEIRDWVQDISESEVNGSTLAGASHYKNGDYTMPHTDKASGSGGEKEKRRIAYILHLTKEWNPKYGGDMVWMNPSYTVHPAFNCMTLFSISQSSWHFVSPVAQITPVKYKRLAFNGWWTSINRREADEIEAKKNDELRFSTFGTVIDGESGALIPHLQAYEKLDGLWVNYVK